MNNDKTIFSQIMNVNSKASHHLSVLLITEEIQININGTYS